jgi:hypothetical protein
MGVLLGLVVAMAPVVVQPAGAADPGGQDYVKYYVVESSYQGHPETLADIATRYLGGASHAAEIFDLNSRRVQPDGGKLTEPAQLHAGWALVLPWDAYGAGVRYGLVPTAGPTPSDQPTPAAAQPPAVAVAGQCASTSKQADGSQSQWGMLRIAPDQAWPHSRGASVLVAVADSGVDASLPAFSGRTTVGADIVSGTGRGNTDCLGSGTAMASIIAARADAGGSVTGVAPDATILPVRLVTENPDARPVDQAAAIEFAIAAGARVIALGGYVTPTDPAVASAIASATGHDVVVVLGAPLGPAAIGSPSTPAGSDAAVLRVGAVGIDGTLAANYAPGSTDVVAPGVGVAALGISGAGQREVTGTQYAVSFVAGEVALVRARFPELTAGQVVHRVKATADQAAGSGARLINPGRSVTQVIPAESPGSSVRPTTAQSAGSQPLRTEALIIMALLVLVTAILLILRMRRIIRPDPPAIADQPAAAEMEREAPDTVGSGLPAAPTRGASSSIEDASAARDGQPARGAVPHAALLTRAGLPPRGRTSNPSWDRAGHDEES